MTNFEYLLCLSLINGRTFSDLDNYPYFPVTVSRQGATTLSSIRRVQTFDFKQWFDGSGCDLNQMHCHSSFPPEVYRSIGLLRNSKVQQPSWSPSAEFFVYNYRKSLEQLSVNVHITDWVYHQFGIHKPKAFQR
jgi:hypothetical protein